MPYEPLGNIGDVLQVGNTLYAPTGQVGELEVLGTLTLGLGGRFLSAPSGNRIEISNAVVGGLIKSSTYVAGSAGWQIKGDGSAEFNNITVRGTIYATAGEIGGLNITGTLTMIGSGKILTAVSGRRIELLAGNAAGVVFYSGSVSETLPGEVFIETVSPHMMILTPPAISTFPGPTSLRLTAGYASIVQASTTRARFDNDQAAFRDGSAGAPGISFLSDINTGLFRVTEDTMGFALGGIERFRMGTTYTYIPDTLAFMNETGTGIVRGGASILDFYLASFGNKVRMSANNGLSGHSSSASSPFIAPNALTSGDTDTGYYGVSDGITAICGNSQITMVFDAPNSDIRPGVDNIYNLGDATFRFVDVWAVDTTINSSDLRDKESILPLRLDSEDMLRNVNAYQFVRKGRNRPHAGWMAQDIAAYLEDKGLDYAILIDPSKVGEEGKMGLRIGELTAVLWDACQKAERRIAALEKERK